MSKRLLGLFLASVALLGFMAYRHWGPTLSHVDSSRYVLPSTDPPPTIELVGPLDMEVDGRHLQGATGSIVNYRSVTLILTAKHLFSDVSDVEMPSLVKRVTLKPVRGDGSFTSTRALYLAGTASMEGDPKSSGRDVAAMLVEQPARGLTLATELAAVGDPVWLELNDGSELSAHITESAPDRLGYQFDKQAAERGSSGSPILDKSGLVIGIHLGGGGGRGIGNPSVNILRYLAERIH